MRSERSLKVPTTSELSFHINYVKISRDRGLGSDLPVSSASSDPVFVFHSKWKKKMCPFYFPFLVESIKTKMGRS